MSYRTHLGGDLRAGDEGDARHARGLGRAPARPRRARLRRPARPGRPRAARVQPRGAARRPTPARTRCAPSSSSRPRASCARRGARDREPAPRDRARSRCTSSGWRCSNDRARAAVPARRRRRRRDAAPAPPLPRPAPRRDAPQRPGALQAHADDPPVPRGARVLGARDADPVQVDAGGRARVPGADVVAPGPLLRAAAVAADLQAALRHLRLRALLPDRPLLPRRGHPRRPHSRVHAARHGARVRPARRAASR